MPRIIQSIHLSDYQAMFMLIVQQASTPELAFAELGKQDSEIEPNLQGAKETLAKLGLVEVGENTVTITPEGEEVMRDEYLIDEMGEVTEKGNELLQMHVDEPSPGEQGPTAGSEDNVPNDATGMDMAPPTAGGEMETTPGGIGESSILKFVNDLSKLQG